MARKVKFDYFAGFEKQAKIACEEADLLAKTIAEYAGHTACDIQPCHSDEFPSPVHRPAYSVLDKTKIKETFGLRIPYWTDSLKRCLKNL